MKFEQALEALREGREVTNADAPRPWKIFMKDAALYWQTLEVVPAPTIYLARFDQRMLMSEAWQLIVSEEPEPKRRGRKKGYVTKEVTFEKIIKRARRIQN